MSDVTCDISISMDGFCAGPNQSLDNPMGEGMVEHPLHRWQFKGAENNLAERAGILGHGAYIMGRNMFGPIRGEWTGDWQGWWGPEPPYAAPVFVLTHYARQPLEMAGGTTFHFVTDGPGAALRMARDAAGERSIAIAGGARTVNQYLASGDIDELRLHIAPILLGAGARLFDGVGRRDYHLVSARDSGGLVTHVTYRRTV